MTHKKLYLSVTATAVIASAFFAAESTEAASYSVKQGDTLWNIAQSHRISVAELKMMNGLSSDIIFPSQVLATSNTITAPPVIAKPKPQPQPPVSSSQTYTVKRGDNLSRIATTHKITLAELMAWNNLETTLIFPGNVLAVSEQSATIKPPVQTEKAPAQTQKPTENNDSTDYTVKSGDTLSRIAVNNRVSIANLKQWNDLKSDLILIGQKLTLDGVTNESGNVPSNTGQPATPVTPDIVVDYNISTLLQTAKSFIGAPYLWGGQTVDGFYCSGFIHFAYNQAGRSGARMNTQGYYDRSYTVDNPQVGDLVFFSNTYRAGISHIGIYLGNNQFIHAGSSTGVTISNLNESYWKKHHDGFKRFY